jgi:hypothetical protein
MLLCKLKTENGPLVPEACLLRLIFQHLSFHLPIDALNQVSRVSCPVLDITNPSGSLT